MEDEAQTDNTNMELNKNRDMNEANTTMIVKDKIDEPKAGMLFNSYDEVYEFYLSYSKKVGFAICKRSCRKADGEVRYATLTCVCEGKVRRTSNKQVNMHPVSKTNCKARISVTVCPGGKWKITSVELNHNHGLSPSKSRLYKCNRVIQTHVKRRLELNDRAVIKMNKSFNSFVVEGGGNENLTFLEKDCRNYIDKVRRLRLGEGDASAIHNYFLKMQADNSDFFHMMDLDDEGRVKNLFWADARSRATFKEFGDVVTFDTTYLTNKYNMPFAPFVGVNHQGQSVLLGCGLISNEDVPTFTWLFRSWLICMHEVAPNAIITDQDKAMKKAIEIVFPNTRHRWCLWHIMKKIADKFGAHKDYKAIKFCMKSAVYDSITINEFEINWSRLITSYNLKENEWLTTLYEERNRWVPAFVKDTFWAGMSTTQRSESMNAFFKDYVTVKTSLKQFVEQYESALRNKVEKESAKDFKSFNSRIPCITHYEMEKQFQNEYTIAKFKEFQEELKGKIHCTYSPFIETTGSIMQYEIGEDKSIGDMIRRTTFKVHFNKDVNEINCSCKLFQCRGILCRHALMVLIDRKIYKIPDIYILTRWSKLKTRSYTKVKIGYNGWSSKPETFRFDKLCKAFYEAADLATDSDDRTNMVIKWINELKIKLATHSRGNNGYINPTNNTSMPCDGEVACYTKETRPLLSPVAIRRKGRPPSNRFKSVIEKVTTKKKSKVKKVTRIEDLALDPRGTQEMLNVKDSYTQNTINFENSNTLPECRVPYMNFQMINSHDVGHLSMPEGFGQSSMVREFEGMQYKFGQSSTVRGFEGMQYELDIGTQRQPIFNKFTDWMGEKDYNINSYE